jgi:hypothetical protein
VCNKNNEVLKKKMGSTQSYELRSVEFKTITTNFSTIIAKYQSLRSDSASPSDTFILTFKPNVTHSGIAVAKAFLKIYLNPNLSNIADTSFPWNTVSAQAGLYELKVYRDRINQLITSHVCPFFVKFLAGSENMSYDELKNMLKVSSQQIIRNLVYMYTQAQNRPALTEPYPSSNLERGQRFQQVYTHLSRKLNNMYFVCNMMEVMDRNTTRTFNEKITEEYRVNRQVTSLVWSVVFQIALACYALSLAKVTHNDLHDGNVWVETIPEQNYVFLVESTYYRLKTTIRAKLFDFDRAYSFAHGNNPINDAEMCGEYSQCNTNIEQLDIVKLLCYMYETYKDDTILDVFAPPPQKTYWKNVFNNANCFLQVVQGQRLLAVPQDEYRKLFAMPVIINNLAQKSTQHVLSNPVNFLNDVTPENFYVLDSTAFDNVGNVNSAKISRRFSRFFVEKTKLERDEYYRNMYVQEKDKLKVECDEKIKQIKKQTIKELNQKQQETQQALLTAQQAQQETQQVREQIVLERQQHEAVARELEKTKNKLNDCEKKVEQSLVERQQREATEREYEYNRDRQRKKPKTGLENVGSGSSYLLKSSDFVDLT